MNSIEYVVSCDINGEWLPDNEFDAYVDEFSEMLRDSSSYEEFMMKHDLKCIKFNAAYLGLESTNDVIQWLKDYYGKTWRKAT